jgi:hypothetical protein
MCISPNGNDRVHDVAAFTSVRLMAAYLHLKAFPKTESHQEILLSTSHLLEKSKVRAGLGRGLFVTLRPIHRTNFEVQI